MNGLVKNITVASKKEWEENRFKTLTIVLGNVSSDLDSAVCSLAYAAYLKWRYDQAADSVCTKKWRQPKDPCPEVFIPVINVAREDYEVKTEVVHLFKCLGIEKADLIFRDDINDDALLSDDHKVKLILVDHHVLCSPDARLNPLVTEIIDHRAREATEWKYPQEVSIDIQMVGSCSTLIASKMRGFRDGCFLKQAKDAATMLYETIILDTSNFCPDVSKGTALDLDLVTFLEEILEIEDPNKNRKEVFDELIHARTDITGLNCKQLLKKDAKPKNNIYVATVPIVTKELLRKPDVEDVLKNFAREYRAIVMIGFRLKGDVMKDIAIYGQAQDVVKLGDFLREWSQPSLELVEESVSITNVRYFRQNNLKVSRKQVMPILDEFIVKYP